MSSRANNRVGRRTSDRTRAGESRGYCCAGAGPALSGIIVPIVTPLRPDFEVDLDGLGALLERVISGGVSGVFVLGTTGEAPSLSLRSKKLVIAETCRFVDGRVPVLVGVSDPAFETVVELGRTAARAGASAVVCMPPYYFRISQAELQRYFELVAGAMPLPLYLYNMPALTKISIHPRTLRALAKIDRIKGIKDSSGNMVYFRSILRVAAARPDWSVLMGPEHLLYRALALGAHGGVNGGAQVAPELFSGFYRAFMAGQIRSCRSCAAKIKALQKIYGPKPESPAVIRAIKYSLARLGVISETVAPPLTPLDRAHRAVVDRVLTKLGLLPGSRLGPP